MSNRLQQLAEQGQAVWLDYLHRRILENGELQRLIAEDGLKGMTSNPSIFEKAIGEGQDYDDRVEAILGQGDLEPGDLYEALAIADIQAAADLFRPVYDQLGAADGYVSLEVSPYLAMDTEATIAEARRLWRAVNRPNVMIKVPGTMPGVPAIRQLIGDGININVTLLFGIDAYLAVAEAHMAGLEALFASGADISKVRGVASFFVSRIDSAIDKEIDRRLKAGAGTDEHVLRALRGKVAIANAKIAYQHYLTMLETPRWLALAKAGAGAQRLLWASTGTKDPAYSDVLYVESLIGPDTVNTMPMKTLESFRNHGQAARTLTAGLDQARGVLAEAERLRLDLRGVTDRLVVDGVRLFADAFDQLLGAVATKRQIVLGDGLNSQGFTLPEALAADVDEVLERARAEGWTRRIWAKDKSLWVGGEADKWLGWLDAGLGRAVDQAALSAFQCEVDGAHFAHAVLLGMGGSSLGPEVLARTFGGRNGWPIVIVLDSTDPEQIRDVEARIDPARTLFIVSSKSGSTLEPNILQRHFFELAELALGEAAAARFIAITDPGSALEETARREGFRRVFHGDPTIGGRYSVLSNFGMVPAAVMGVDLAQFLAATVRMTRACGPSAPPSANPGVHLGAVLGAAAKAGRDKVTILASEPIADLGAWLEQLLAESTGKQGKGLIPIAAEPLGEARAYGDDRLFVYLRLGHEDEVEFDTLARDLEEAGHPVVRIILASRDLIGQEFFRWEMATAVAGAVIGIDPFDQPDVEAAKIETRKLTEAYERGAKPDGEAVLVREGELSLYADVRNAEVLDQSAGTRALEAMLGAHFRRAHEGDYIGLLAYLDRSPRYAKVLQGVRKTLRDRTRSATALGFGPRYLHSTGQAYKGGPNSGVFLEITAQPEQDIPVPGQRYTFGLVEAAQARGDFEVMAQRGRRILRLDLGRDVDAGLRRFAEAVERSLG